ncbi:MAG TPA: hypothetical protein VFY10_11045 [Dehalococcoidia bacterium]|nr:hypothetical protein [Dehalococcoidia bacterium]
MSVDRDALDYASILIQVAMFIVTGGGLLYVARALSQGGKQQRLESGPYVRVDIGTTEAGADFAPPETYFHRKDVYSDVLTNDGEVVMLTAWFRNYQEHPLGMALGVAAVFLIEVEGRDPVLNDVYIAYVERDKPVAVDIVRVSRSSRVTVTLLSVSYVDFYDSRYEHTYGEKGENGLHGRMICTVDGDGIKSIPNGRSRGRGVDFDN